MLFVFLDLDGTLLNDEKTIPVSTLKFLQELECSGRVKICIMTARSARLSGIKSDVEKICSTMILHNGAEIYDKGKLIYQCYLSAEDIRYIYQTLHGEELKISVIADKYYCNYPAEKIWGAIDHAEITDFNKFNVDAPKINIFNPERKQIKELDALKEMFRVEYMDDCSSISIAARQASKGEAISVLQRIFKVSQENSIAIGNDYNDLSAFSVCGTKVAVENADECLLELADVIISSNNELGVEKYLRKVLGTDAE